MENLIKNYQNDKRKAKDAKKLKDKLEEIKKIKVLIEEINELERENSNNKPAINEEFSQNIGIHPEIQKESLQQDLERQKEDEEKKANDDEVLPQKRDDMVENSSELVQQPDSQRENLKISDSSKQPLAEKGIKINSFGA